MTHPLLELLDAIVSLDRQPAGFVGSLCFGIAREDGARFWCASFGARVETRFIDLYRGDADTLVVLSEEEAHRLISGVGQAAPVEVAGSTKVLSRFVRRYLARANLISVRGR